ncbi:hypothetical protein AOLI_G00084200 [Acnodon oligacanthus]
MGHCRETYKLGFVYSGGDRNQYQPLLIWEGFSVDLGTLLSAFISDLDTWTIYQCYFSCYCFTGWERAHLCAGKGERRPERMFCRARKIHCNTQGPCALSGSFACCRGAAVASRTV